MARGGLRTISWSGDVSIRIILHTGPVHHMHYSLSSQRHQFNYVNIKKSNRISLDISKVRKTQFCLYCTSLAAFRIRIPRIHFQPGSRSRFFLLGHADPNLGTKIRICLLSMQKQLIKKFKLTFSVVLFISDALIADFLAHLLYFLISVDTLNWSRVRMDNFKHFVRGHSRFISNRTLNYKMQSYLTDTATYMRFISYRKLKIHIHYTVSLYIYTVYTCTL